MRLAMIVVALVTLAACQTQPAQSFCSAARPILLDRGDKLTDATARAIVGLNEIGVRLCGWKAPGR